MKRFLSIILAISLVMSLMPTMFASAEDDATITYTFSATLIDKNDKTVWTGDFGIWSLQNLISYGDHGFKFWTADKYTLENASSVAYLLQFMDAALRIYSKKDANTVYNKEGTKATIALEKPSSVPSFYQVKVGHHSNSDAKKPGIFLSYLNEGIKDVNYYTSEEKRVSNVPSFNGSKTITLNDIIYHDGEKDIAFTAFGGIGSVNGDTLPGNLQLTKVELVPVKVTDIAFSIDVASCLAGESKRIQIKATLEDNTTMKVVDSFVTYKSSDPSIATISEDGTITALKNGTTTITATVGEFSATQTFTVGKRTYSFVKPSIATADWDGSFTEANIKGSIIPLIGYGSHGYKYWDTDEATFVNAGTNVRALQYYTGGLRVWSFSIDADQDFSNKDGAKLALALTAPKKGFYKVVHTSASSDKAANYLHVYMNEISAAEEASEERRPVESFISDKNLVERSPSSNTGSHEYDRIIAPSGENNLIWTVFVDPESQFSMKSLSFIELPVSAITLAADAEEIALDGTTAVNAKANDMPIAHSFVTYESLNPEIAKVSDTGVVTAVAPGKATIKATALDYSATATVTVAEPEPEEPGEELTETVTFGYFAEPSHLENLVTAPGYTAGLPTQVAVGTKITLTARDSDNSAEKFKYWMISGRFYSAEKEITLTVARNTSVRAVYENEDEIAESGSTFVRYWESDKILSNTDVFVGDTLLSAPGKADDITGMRFVGWYIDEETMLTKDTVLTETVTNVVAKYEPLDTEYTVKVNGEENKGTYNSPVSVSAPEAFTYWKLGEEKLSFRRAFEFFNYGNAELISVFDESAKAIPTVVIEKNLGAAFITYDTPAGYERIEAGIIFGNSAAIDVNSANSKANAQKTAAFGQFTAKPMDGETYARGYQIFKKDGIIRVIYTEAIEI